MVSCTIYYRNRALRDYMKLWIWFICYYGKSTFKGFPLTLGRDLVKEVNTDKVTVNMNGQRGPGIQMLWEAAGHHISSTLVSMSSHRSGTI